MMNIQGQRQLQGKLFITANLKLITGMHIGANSDFAPIGAVDSPFIRDCLTHEPIIPGSSLKGKIRTLLAKSRCKNLILNNIDDDDEVISRLFGLAGKKGACFQLLQMDYLGGHGSRGYGRVKFNDFKVKAINKKIDADEYGYFFEGKCS